MKRGAVIVVLALLAFAAAACASFPEQILPFKTLTVATNSDYYPFSYMEDGQLTGFDYEFGKALCTELDVRCKWVVMDFKDILNGVESGEVDVAVASVAITPERKRRFEFSIPYYSGEFQFYGREDAPEITGEDFRIPAGSRVAVLRASIYQNLLESEFGDGVTVLPFDTMEEVLKAISGGDADYTLVDDTIVPSLAHNYPSILPKSSLIGKEALARLETYLGDGSAGVITQKGNRQLINSINSAIFKLRDNEEASLISSSYGFKRDITSFE